MFLDNILSMEKFIFEQKTPREIIKELVQKIQKRRKKLKISQADLAKRSGVSLGSIKRFETTLPEKYKVASGEAKLNGCIFEINDENCRVMKINRIIRK